MSALVLEAVDTDGTTVEHDYRAEGRVRRFLSEESFAASYDVDVSGVPPSLLSIPWLANYCPVAWATGADVTVPTLDASFGAALERVRASLVEMYPEFVDGGEIRGERVVEPAIDPGGREGSALLFSGGVDSLTTYVRHRDEDPTLVSVAGADVSPDEAGAWEHNRAIIEGFADERGLDTAFVGTDMHGFLDGQLIVAHFQRYLDHTWWAGVQHGLGLLGLCAPVAHAEGIGDLYIAATHTADFEEPWGSHPSIDDHVAWSGTTAHHDGYELSRQEKLGVLAEYVREEAPALTIRSCHESSTGGNCNRCEKCARTIVGLLIAGLDPEDHGYEVRDGTFEAFRERLESGGWELGADQRFMWADLQAHVAPDTRRCPDTGDGPDSSGAPDSSPDLDPDGDAPHPGASAFLAWLDGVDLERFVDRSGPPLHRRQARRVARNLPYPVFRGLLPVYARLQRLLG